MQIQDIIVDGPWQKDDMWTFTIRFLNKDSDVLLLVLLKRAKGGETKVEGNRVHTRKEKQKSGLESSSSPL